MSAPRGRSGWRRQGEPEEVRVHDFLIKELGRAVPCGIYDLASNAGWVGVGITHDTAASAVQTIRRWWQEIGGARYPEATRPVITADGGGSNGYRVRLWKREVQRLADEAGIAIEVHYLPPGTSKWNKIEHRLFSFISQNWRAKPLVSYQVIVDLICHHLDRSRGALRARRQYISQGRHRLRRRNSRPQHRMRRISREWNYTIYPPTAQIERLIPDER
jgi:Rhodopirellula transposase DDE domain